MGSYFSSGGQKPSVCVNLVDANDAVECCTVTHGTVSLNGHAERTTKYWIVNPVETDTS